MIASNSAVGFEASISCFMLLLEVSEIQKFSFLCHCLLVCRHGQAGVWLGGVDRFQGLVGWNIVTLTCSPRLFQLTASSNVSIIQLHHRFGLENFRGSCWQLFAWFIGPYLLMTFNDLIGLQIVALRGFIGPYSLHTRRPEWDTRGRQRKEFVVATRCASAP